MCFSRYGSVRTKKRVFVHDAPGIFGHSVFSASSSKHGVEDGDRQDSLFRAAIVIVNIHN